jgi:hypothetical protein
MVLPLMNNAAHGLLMVPVTLMPLPGAGAVAPKGDSNSWARPRPWPVPNTFSLLAICALSNVAMGLSGIIISSPHDTKRARAMARACLLPSAQKWTQSTCI